MIVSNADAASWHFIESPLLKLKKKFEYKRPVVVNPDIRKSESIVSPGAFVNHPQRVQ